MATEIADNTQHSIEEEIMCLEALYPQNNVQENNNPLVAFKATADPDTVYLHQATKELDQAEFLKAMIKEVTNLMNNKTFKLI